MNEQIQQFLETVGKTKPSLVRAIQTSKITINDNEIDFTFSHHLWLDSMKKNRQFVQGILDATFGKQIIIKMDCQKGITPTEPLSDQFPKLKNLAAAETYVIEKLNQGLAVAPEAINAYKNFIEENEKNKLEPVKSTRLIEYVGQVIGIETREISDQYLKISKDLKFNAMTPIEQLLEIGFRHVFRQTSYESSLSAQYQIGEFRVDFLVSVWQFKQPKKKHSAIVECDGHDFHERTKHQASEDKKRDRKLQGMGYNVLRFTGSDIWKDPTQCAQDVKDFLENKLRG